MGSYFVTCAGMYHGRYVRGRTAAQALRRILAKKGDLGGVVVHWVNRDGEQAVPGAMFLLLASCALAEHKAEHGARG